MLFAGKAIDYLLRARKAVRLYPDRNPVTEKAVDDLHQELIRLLSIQDRIAFEIRQDAILFEMEEIFRSASAENDIAHFLYRDGIREISFRKGLTRDEVLGLVHVLSIDFGRELAAEDVVTRIWEKDFRHIRCIIYEPGLFDPMESRDTLKSAPLDTASLSAELKRVYRDAVVRGDEICTVTDIIEYSDEELLSLRRDVDNNRLDRTGKVLAIALELFLLAETEEYGSLEISMKQAVEYALAGKKLDVLADFFIRVKAAYMDSSKDSGFRSSLVHIFSFFSSERFLVKVGSVLDEGVRLDEDTFEKFTRLLDGRSVPVLIRLLGYLDTIAARKTVVNLLAAIGNADMPALTGALYDGRWYVVRNIVIVLRLIGDRQAKRHLISILDHKDGRVRREAIKAMAELGGNEAVALLRRALDDPDISVRQFALGSLSKLDDDRAKRLLVEKVNARGFRNRGYAEKREYYCALLRYEGEDVIKLLGDMLLKETFFGRAANDENRAAIAHCVGMQKNKAFLPFLCRIENRGSGLLRQSVSESIRKIEHGS
jgi:HEAT repeat protein